MNSTDHVLGSLIGLKLQAVLIKRKIDGMSTIISTLKTDQRPMTPVTAWKCMSTGTVNACMWGIVTEEVITFKSAHKKIIENISLISLFSSYRYTKALLLKL